MKVTLVIPIEVYRELVEKCFRSSREFAILTKLVIFHVPDDRIKGAVELPCEIVDAKALLDYAIRVHPEAVPYIERSLGDHIMQTWSPAREYRKKATGDTWHFCSTCSQWPTEDFLTLAGPPRGHMLCNECIVREWGGN